MNYKQNSKFGGVKNMIRILASLVVTAVISSHAMAACQVPVCDIPATIADLKTKTSDVRSAFYSDLYQNNLSSKDQAVLRNLNAFGAQAYKLSKDLNDAKVTVKWAADVRQIGQGLLTYASFNKAEFISTYSESASMPELTRDSQQRVRYAALFRWRTAIPVMFNVKEIYEVYDYVQKSSDFSISIGDEDYIVREASNVLELLSARISYLFPLYEGVYSIKTTCNQLVGQCSEKDLASDRLVVMDSLTDHLIVASLAISSEISFNYAIGNYNDTNPSHETDGINFLFYKSYVKNSGTELYSKSDVLYVGDRPAEIKFTVAQNQDVSGSAVTSRYVGALNYAGKVIFSPLKYYTDEVPLQAGEQPITGEFTGKFGSHNMRLIIRQKMDKALMASAFVDTEDNGNFEKFDFSMGNFVTHRQLINLTGIGMINYTPYKIAMAYRFGADNKLHWFGGFYSVNGLYSEIALDYVGPVTGL
ncbi:hypothetical protein CIK05_14265 [Bdellovibrio sp. qaytius]|nr:hypothetical protein CIK05_14265 [Bdellovibrio sp. qaytius]